MLNDQVLGFKCLVLGRKDSLTYFVTYVPTYSIRLLNPYTSDLKPYTFPSAWCLHLNHSTFQRPCRGPGCRGFHTPWM
jgi:hypothetical protein